MSLLISTLIVTAIIALPYWVSIRAAKRIYALESKGQVHIVCGHLLEFNPYMSKIDQFNVMRDSRILNFDVRAWDSKCASI